jgi:TonB-linked SusC/RagA family outer membrane protein
MKKSLQKTVRLKVYFGFLTTALFVLLLWPQYLFGVSLPSARLEREVTGKVTDEKGEAIPGVNIIIKGSTVGTVTTDEGKYRITVPNEQAILVFSYVGFEKQEVEVVNLSVVDVSLKTAATLGEVVVIGYGNESVKKLTTSVSTINAKQINDQPIATISDAFTGNVSGVFVDQNSGRPGDAPVIRIRGYGSINAGSEPLYIIDGMIVTNQEFRLLNPKSVENISVLKDAAAGAIYGSRAGNGVIIVTTKSGKGKPKLSYNATAGVSHVEKKIPVLSGPEFVEFTRKAYAASGTNAPTFSPDIANTNWQDEIFQTGMFQNHQLSANGSSESVRYNLSLNYIDNKGTVLTLGEKQYSSNGMFDISLSKKLKVGLTYNATLAKTRTNSKLGGPGHRSGGIMEDAIVQYPVIPAYMPNGDYGQVNSKNWGTPVVYGGYGNPVAALLETDDRTNQFSGIGKGFLNFEPIEGLNINGSLMGRIMTNNRAYHESPYLAANGHSLDANFSNPRFDNIVAGQHNQLTTQYISEGYAEYKKTFGLNQLGITAGGSAQYTGFRGTNADASVNDRGANANTPLPRFDNYFRPNIWGANDVRGSGGFWEETFSSTFGRLNYDYSDKYIFMASLRRDGSSKFAPGSRYGLFPAVAAAWRLSEERFFKKQKLVNDLKLRMSYGISGNDQINNYAWQGSVNYGQRYLFGPSGISDGVSVIAYPSGIENSKLKWETNEQFNFGIDLGIWNGRIQLVADYYIKNTRDMLLSRPLPSENGIASSIMDNIGNMTNKGFEFSLTTENIRSGDFGWTTNWIFNKVRNKVTAIHTSDGILRLGSGEYDMVWIVKGQEMFQLYGYKMLGVFENEAQLQQYPRPRNAKLGDPIQEDVDKDGVINTNDLQKVGKALPDFTFGWNNTFTYGDFDLNIVVDGSQGASKYLPLLRNQSWVSPIEGNISQFIYEGAGTVYGAANLDYTGNRLTQNSYHVFDASFVRIKSLALGYRLPGSLTSRMAVEDIRLSFSVQNLYTFTSYPWYNPQANYFGGSAGTAQYGVDYGGVPLSRTFALGINLTF